ncbi:hypothetical protein ABID30_001975 [Enterococcus rotai]|uniref:MucBP domain-containing protein n=1 Tax=Enterococcus rotai TaxID=118060 RepID=A0A0U2WXR5_9ENTE|nr:MucBP domain-containing protein [Enterococcus rotai]ALS36826.1 hypothetical protein ATZ35_06550 [Enterococcus rotai]
MKKKMFFLAMTIIMSGHSFPVSGQAISDEELQGSQDYIENKELTEHSLENGVELIEQSSERSVQKSVSNQENKEELETISPIYRVHNQAYGSFEESLFPYNSPIVLNIPIYDYSEQAQYLPTLYIVIPKEIKLFGGLSSLQAELDRYLMINGNIKGGQLIASKLNDTPNGREAYQITPTEGTYIDGILQDRNLHLVLEAPDKKSNVEKIILNANKISEIADYNILFFGYDKKNLTNVNGKNPVIDASACGIEGSDMTVATSVSSQHRQEVYFYIQKIKDSYKLINYYTGELIEEKSIVGDFGDVYSRIGLVNSLESWGLPNKDYSEDSLFLESGDINGAEILTTEARNPEGIVEGKNYSVFVKKYAGDIEIRFIDVNGENIISKEILSGFVGQEYTTQAKELQGWLVETEFPENQNGVFTEEPQEITYRYDRKDGEPVVVKYVDENGNKLAVEEILYGKVGLEYKSQVKQIEGWEIKEDPINAEGKFMEVSQEVIYVYSVKAVLPKEDSKLNKEKPAGKLLGTLNEEKPMLPRTGGKYSSFISFTQLGLIFILTSIIIFYKRKKAKNT